MSATQGVAVAPAATAGDGRVATAATLRRARTRDALTFSSELRRSHEVALTRDLLHPDNPLLAECIAGRRALTVLTPSVQRLYGRRVLDYFAAHPGAGVDVMVLERSESTKSLDAAVEVCERAAAAGLRRTSPIVALGGGVCTDICGLAAMLHRRGVPHIKIPTTLVGLIDAGIATKNAVNHGGKKSALGTFHPPEYSLLDTGFLATLPRRHLVNGMAEIIKLAVVSDAALFALLARHGPALVDSRFASPAAAGAEVVWRSVAGMLAELARNPFEVGDLRRKVDFGHTFSPYIEVASDHRILHGEAVALDVALSTQVAHELGLLPAGDLDRILGMLSAAGLALVWPELSVAGLWSTLQAVVEHRDGDLHLVVPTAIGACGFLGLDAISPALLAACSERLAQRCAGAGGAPPGAGGAAGRVAGGRTDGQQAPAQG